MTAKPGTQEIIDRIQAMIVTKKDSDDLLLEVTGPVSASVLMKDRRYKTKPLVGNEELTFSGIRAGKRDEFIFEFTPVDDQPFVQVEFSEAKVFASVKGFEDRLVKMLGFEGSHEIDWRDACLTFVEDVEAKAKAEAEAAELARQAAEHEADAIYERNPVFAMFG